ncbi:type III pantothenate kinase [Mollicutes bacterium LVI A0039]|nr:type III pantothenate kinase [Mollicutes bacterium LVI A0039]
MILIDLGNTSAKIYDGAKTTIPKADIFEYLKTINDPVLLCSVVPSYNQVIEATYKNVKIITNSDYNLLFDNQNSQLNSKGADRIVAAYGAVQKYQSKVVVVDIGTCLTLDVVDDRKYLSGLIYPGFEMLENILAEKVKQLQKPKFAKEMILTENQIYWANIYGFIGAIKNMLAMLAADKDFKVVLTGGTVVKLKEEHDIDLIAELSEYDVVYDPMLIQIGLTKFVDLI